jgi:hypothetical protein
MIAAAPVPPSPPAPVMPSKTWTAEEATQPIMRFACNLLDLEGRSGKLDFVVTGGRAYPATNRDKEYVPGFTRTRQHVALGVDELGLLPAGEASEVEMWPTTGKFFVELKGATPPPAPYGSRTWRSVLISYNYRLPLAITVNAVPRAQLASGFCAVTTQPQEPLSPEEAARERAA